MLKCKRRYVLRVEKFDKTHNEKWVWLIFKVHVPGPPTPADGNETVSFVCAGLCRESFRLCCSPSQDIEDSFWGRGAVCTGAFPPPPFRIELKLVSFVCAGFVLDCAVNLFVCAAAQTNDTGFIVIRGGGSAGRGHAPWFLDFMLKYQVE